MKVLKNKDLITRALHKWPTYRDNDLKLTSYVWLEKLKEVWGGEVYRLVDNRQGYALMWRWNVTGDAMVALLKAVKPHLRLKKEQAELLLELQARIGRIGRTFGQPLSMAELERRRNLYIQCRLLNRKGPRGDQLGLPEPSPQLQLLRGQ